VGGNQLDQLLGGCDPATVYMKMAAIPSETEAAVPIFPCLRALPLRDDRWFLLQYLMSFNFRVAVWVG
jgi:hypothetical protein